MNDVTHDQLVAELARDLVAQVAPQELPLFRAHRDAYFADPEKALRRQPGTGEMLGFGAEAAVPFLTPIVFAVVTEAVTFLGEEVKKSVKAEGGVWVSDLVKKLFKKFRPGQGKTHEPMPPALTPEQLQHVHTLAVKIACQCSLPEAQAKQLADALIGDLVIPG